MLGSYFRWGNDGLRYWPIITQGIKTTAAVTLHECSGVSLLRGEQNMNNAFRLIATIHRAQHPQLAKSVKRSTLTRSEELRCLPDHAYERHCARSTHDFVYCRSLKRSSDLEPPKQLNK